jgi:hypothetical protein
MKLPPNLGVSLSEFNYVLLNFEFTDSRLIPANIPFIERSAEEEAARAIRNKTAHNGGTRGHQWLEGGQLVSPELLVFSLPALGFEVDKLQASRRSPDAGRGGMTKWMVNVRFRRSSYTPPPEEVAEAPFKGGKEDDGSGAAFHRLMSYTWAVVHGFDNRPSGKDNVSFHFMHRREIGKHQNALVAHRDAVAGEDRLDFLSAEGALALNVDGKGEPAYEFSKPEEHAPVPSVAPSSVPAPVIVRTPPARPPHHQDGRGQHPQSRRGWRNARARQRNSDRQQVKGGNVHPPLTDAELLERHIGPVSLEEAFRQAGA